MKSGRSFISLVLPLVLTVVPACHLTSGIPYKPTLEAIATREDLRVGVEEIFPYLDYESLEVRRRAALALARLRNPEAVDFIQVHLDKERDTQVAEILLFALGQIGDPLAADVLLKFFASSVGRVRAAAVEAAGKIQDPSLTLPIVERLREDESYFVRAEACLALFRLGAKRYELGEVPPEIKIARNEALTQSLLTDKSPAVRWRAAYALSGIQDPATVPALREALLKPEEDMWVRCFAARALGHLPTSEETQQVLAKACAVARDRGEWNVAVEALRGLGNYEDLETAALLINYLDPVKNTNLHIRATAARTLGRFYNGGETIVKALMRATEDRSRTVKGEAIVALGDLGDPDQFLEDTAEYENRFIRLKTVEAASLMGLDGLDLLLLLAEDVSIRVRCAALEYLSDPIYGEYKEDIIPLAREAVQLDDMSLRYAAAQLLMKLGSRESLPLLKSAYRRSMDPEMSEARLKIVEAVAAMGGPDDVEFFRSAVLDGNFAVRNAAAKALASISGELIQVEPKSIVRQVIPELGVDYHNDTPNPVAHLVTRKGEFWVELFKDDAPIHVKSFIQLAQEGVYNKLTIHRMVSNFVVQGLDPRGDGWGFNNLRLRDEINQRKFLRGYVGMPNSGPDTGGCQIFITHCPTPHLDGNYTVMGRVIYGMNVVDTLEVGDQVLRITIK